MTPLNSQNLHANMEGFRRAGHILSHTIIYSSWQSPLYGTLSDPKLDIIMHKVYNKSSRFYGQLKILTSTNQMKGYIIFSTITFFTMYFRDSRELRVT